MFRRFVSMLSLLLMAPTVAAAQARASLVKGQRVRVTSRCEIVGGSVPACPTPGTPWPHEWTYSGELVALDADTLRIRRQSNEVAFAIPTASIAGLAYRAGTKGNAWRGAFIGLLGGALLGGVIGSTTEWCILSCSPATGLGVAIGAPAGLLLGSVIGTLIRSDRWQTVSVSGHRISVIPRLDAIGLTVAATF
jgi:hypothetical protein